ncbi:MAG: hypothetical protein M3R51_10265 [Candidatus Eremiobacteraeota bacterium]|nr:hypothetical protein [Candidatus Eremiobacteraeota bacterium]
MDLATPPALSKSEGLLQIETFGPETVLLGNDAIWRRHGAQWDRIVNVQGTCGHVLAISSTSVWCVANGPGSMMISRASFGGSLTPIETSHSTQGGVSEGFADDAWLGENDAFIVHVTASGITEKIPVSSPINGLSRGPQAMWFGERDGSHYGFIDRENNVHEFAATQRLTSVRAGRDGAWLTQPFRDSWQAVRHADVNGTEAIGSYVAGMRESLVAADGSLWAQSDDWPTLIHLTEAGRATRYRFPCPGGPLNLLQAPSIGMWFLSADRHCSGIADETGIYVRELPLVRDTEYK